MVRDRHVWEGWTVHDFINDLEPTVELIQKRLAITKPFTSKENLKKWLVDNQPYYKKHIPEVYDYFREKYNIK